MAHWYLQGRLTQNEDYSVVLDQSRYMALIASRFLPQHNNTNVTKEDKTKHESPLPATLVPTKKDCETNLLEVQQLEQTYGFQYSSVIGMLIFFLNTASVLQYGIRKLARFNAPAYLERNISKCSLIYYTMCKPTSMTMEWSSTYLKVTHWFMIWLNVVNQTLTFLLFLLLSFPTPCGKIVWILEEAQEPITFTWMVP